MRIRVSNEEAMHLWANQAQSHARGNSVFFNDATIYSYGEHFPMARIYKEKAGTCVLFTTRSYGITTAKHLTMTRRAIASSTPVFNVPYVLVSKGKDYIGTGQGTHAGNLSDYAERIAKAKEQLDKKRKYSEHYASALTRLVNEANAYSAFFKLRKRFKQPYTDEQLTAMVAAKEARLQELDETRATRQRDEYRRILVRDFPLCAERIHTAFVEKEERARKRAVECAELVAKWRNGEHVYLPYDIPTMLRIEGDNVVTSRSARFPVTHARLGLALVERVRATGQEYKRNGHTLHLGPYAIDKIAVDGTVYAGCHIVTYDEISRIASDLASAPSIDLAECDPQS